MKIMGWTPPQRPAWVKVIMKIPGTTKVQLSLLMILAISSVSSTGLLIFRQGNNTLEESISGRNESLAVEVEGLRLKVTGKNTTEVLKNLMKSEKVWGIIHSVER